MQNLGLSEGTPKTDNRLRAWFWPRIENAVDADLASRQAFWLCLWVAAASAAMLALSGIWAGFIVIPVFLLGAPGVREKSFFAAGSVLFWYLLSWFEGVNVAKVLFTALLITGFRAALWARKNPELMKSEELQLRESSTLKDRMVDVWPA